MTTNGKNGWPHRGEAEPTTIPPPAVEYLVIVHPAGSLDDERAARYWTEVPDLSACTADGATVDQAVENTHRAIARWLSQVASRGRPETTTPAFRLNVELAF